ncbi:SprB repeat-containing protein [Flavobacterium hibisci]|uniref:SprB repeat-containing protein n=1 Tax=Flavobacterium hibisci TaxID=1914462 RepID=UPI001CC0CB0C|nr:SprB repeat-containing protein [Flavobacterium hibisci]MBZ4043848.1 SprB repeat-containing protein [Flavobacterium hibisci]
MKKLLFLFVFINSYWTFGQLTYTFDVEYYACGVSSNYCSPNSTSGSWYYSNETFNSYFWSFGSAGEDFRGSRDTPRTGTYTTTIDNEFMLWYHYDYDNSFNPIDSKFPGRNVETQYSRYYWPGQYPNPHSDLYYGEARGRIFYQDRHINWNYEVRYTGSNTWGTDTYDDLIIEVPFSRVSGSNCYSRIPYGNENTIASDPLDRDYCIECSIITGGIAYDGVDDTPDGHITISNFRPNDLVISRTDKNSTNIIAGEQITLEAKTPAANTTNLFPAFVYNWQYSTDGGIYWHDVPDKLVNNLKINKTNKTMFTMQEMLGAGHTSVFGPIDFRLGYGTGDRSFCNILHFNYDPGAPVVTGVEYVAPKCSGDPVTSLDVYFSRKLEAGESLWPVQIVRYPKESQDQPKLSQDVVTNLVYDPIKGKYKHSFIITTVNNKLINNTTYAVEYQGMVNGVGRGYLLSEQPFVYQDPEPLTFTISPTDPLCHDGEGGLTINVKGGSGKYSYSLDEGTKIPFTVTTVETSTTTNNIMTISRSASQPLSLSVTDAKKSYKIKVTDEHGCIEKTL